MPAILTEAEASRIEWVSEMIGIGVDESLATFCQIKSTLLNSPSLVVSIKARLNAGLGGEGKGARALFLMVKGALGGAIAGFAFKGLGTAVAAFLGVAAAAEIIAVILFLIGAIMLFSSIYELPGALRALASAASDGDFEGL